MAWLNLKEEIEDMFSILPVPTYDIEEDRLFERKKSATAAPTPIADCSGRYAEYRERHRDEIKARWARDKQKNAERKRAYYEANKEQIKAKRRERYAASKAAA